MRFAKIAVVCAALISPVLIGCDKEVSHQDSTTHNPITGNDTSKDTTTYQRPDGSTYTDKSQQTNPAPAPSH
jgi:hypothetical protein